MGTKLSTFLAGALVLGVMTSASATEQVPLSDEQLDAITAGSWGYLITDKSTGLSGGACCFDTKQEAHQLAKESARSQDGKFKITVYEQ
jgi:hypothetical protein